MSNKIDITLLIDNSGSMSTIRDDMEGALGHFLQEQKKFDDSCVSYYKFSGSGTFQEVFTAKPIQEIESNSITITPQGSTALIDAWCTTIDKTGQRLAAMNEADRPKEVILVVITDGMENDSKEFNNTQLQERIKTQEEVYKWKMVYLGANQVSAEVLKNAGSLLGCSMSYTADTTGIKRMSQFAAYAVNSARSGTWTAGDQGNITKTF